VKKTSCLIGAPFSANNMYTPIGKGQLVKSKKYRAWIEKNIPLIKEGLSKAEKFPILIEICILADWRWTQRNDPDNCLKPIIDCLVNSEIIPNDNNRFVESVMCKFLYFPTNGMGAQTRISYEEPPEVIV